MRRSALNQVRYRAHNISTSVCSSTELILLLGRHFVFQMRRWSKATEGRSLPADTPGCFQRTRWRRTVSPPSLSCPRLMAVCNSVTRLCCVCRRREARPRRFHLLQRSGWKSRGDRGQLEHDARLLRCHSYRKFYVRLPDIYATTNSASTVTPTRIRRAKNVTSPVRDARRGLRLAQELQLRGHKEDTLKYPLCADVMIQLQLQSLNFDLVRETSQVTQQNFGVFCVLDRLAFKRIYSRGRGRRGCEEGQVTGYT